MKKIGTFKISLYLAPETWQLSLGSRPGDHLAVEQMVPSSRMFTLSYHRRGWRLRVYRSYCEVSCDGVATMAMWLQHTSGGRREKMNPVRGFANWWAYGWGS